MKNLLFYYPQHFNRTAQASNPFFDKMLAICDKYYIPYDILEEPDGSTNKPRNPKAHKADVFFWTVTVIRKICSTFLPKKNFYERERITAKIFNFFTFGRFRYKKYITISGSMYHLFANLNMDAAVYDMQHGVLYKHHPTFFDPVTGRLREHFYASNLHMIFWGEGFFRCFVRGEEEHMRGKAHVLGYPVELVVDKSMIDNSSKKEILVSMQFTHSVSCEELNRMKHTLSCFLEQTAVLPVNVLLKHHPRYNNSIDIDDLLERFENVSLTDASFEELLDRVLLHVTYFSTTAFEFARFGIPTFFMSYEDKTLEQTLFYDEYRYPLYLNSTIKEVISRLGNPDNFKVDSEVVKRWYSKFYSPFDENAFLNLII